MPNQGSEVLFFSIANNIDNVFVFKSNMKTNISQWSDNAVAYFGLPEDYEKNVVSFWISRIHPDDREEYVENLNAVFGGKLDKHQIQYRVKNYRNDYVWVECMGNVLRDENSQPDIFAGIITRLDNQTKYDALTKKLTIHQFYQFEELNENCIVMMVGMDDFRKAIHNYGYEEGNKIILSLAEQLSVPDLRQRIYRMNGDGFLIVLPEINEEQSKNYFDTVLRNFRESNVSKGFTSHMTFSGAADLHNIDGCDKAILMKHLEHSMEQAKSSNGGKLVFFSDELEQEHKRIDEITRELENSVANDFYGFEVYYQPIVSAKTGRIQTVEALLRFKSETLGMISPLEFVPILEKTKMIQQVGLFVMRQVVLQNKIWNEKYNNIRTGFNVSYLQLDNRVLIQELIEEVRKQNVRPETVIIELTESCKVIYPERLAAMFHELIEQGFLVALDDFGVEYSNMTLLRDLQITTVKIDHSFVRTITGDQKDKERANLAIIKGMITMCKELNYRVVVEGVETKYIADIMEKMGVEFLQGYYYSKPVTAEEAEKLFS